MGARHHWALISTALESDYSNSVHLVSGPLYEEKDYKTIRASVFYFFGFMF